MTEDDKTKWDRMDHGERTKFAADKARMLNVTTEEMLRVIRLIEVKCRRGRAFQRWCRAQEIKEAQSR